MKKGVLVAAVRVLVLAGIFVLSYLLSAPEQENQQQPQEQNTALDNSNTNVEAVEEDATYNDLVKLTSPLPNGRVESPLTVTGEARGTWYFEGSFPVVLVDWDGLIIAQGIATTQGEWMTEDYVPFTATIDFTKPTVKDNGALILQKDNPSGLPENDDAYEVPVFFD
ncbi:MAG: Gmad2 immunoglobulin-like domain-containing protein [Candidatus Kerfeldbacteria bacterium]